MQASVARSGLLDDCANRGASRFSYVNFACVMRAELCLSAQYAACRCGDVGCHHIVIDLHTLAMHKTHTPMSSVACWPAGPVQRRCYGLVPDPSWTQKRNSNPWHQYHSNAIGCAFLGHRRDAQQAWVHAPRNANLHLAELLRHSQS